MLFTHGARPPHVRYKTTVASALKQIRRERPQQEAAPAE
jgi:hypothetical protein